MVIQAFTGKSTLLATIPVGIPISTLWWPMDSFSKVAISMLCPRWIFDAVPLNNLTSFEDLFYYSRIAGIIKDRQSGVDTEIVKR